VSVTLWFMLGHSQQHRVSNVYPNGRMAAEYGYRGKDLLSYL
jgi:hypothetical protein